MQKLLRPGSRALALIALVALPAAADAQFGGLMKKAKDKVEEKGAEKAGPVTPGEQLSDDLLAKVIAGAQAADRVLAGRDRVTEQRTAKDKELSALLEKNGPVRSSYDQANEKILSCRSAGFRNADETRQAQMTKRMQEIQSDPAMMGKMQLASMKYARAMSDAQQKNDPVALQKAQMQMMQEVTGMDVFAALKKDTVAVDAKCGKAPMLPASLVQEEKLRKEISVAVDSLRTLEAQAVNQGAAASGLDQVRYLQLKERALSIMNRMDGTGAKVKYGDAETDAVKKRRAELDKLKRAM